MLARRRIEKQKEERDVYGLIVLLWHRRQTVRREAAVALGYLDDRRAVPSLIGALSDEKPSVRRAAAQSLGRLKGPDAAEPLITALEDRSKQVRLAAIKALGALADPRSTRPLIAVLRNEDEDERVRWAAAEALGEIGDPRAFEPLFSLLGNGSLRRAAKRSLTRVLTAETVPALVDALHDKQPEVRLFAKGALVGWWGSDAIEPLALALQSQDSEVRAVAAIALSHTRDVNATTPLIGAPTALMVHVPWPLKSWMVGS